MKNISIILVFIEGLASFLSPCLLPLLPVYIGYFSGEIIEGKYNRKKLIINSIAFSLGLTLIFILLGLTISSFGRFLSSYRDILIKIASIIIIIFGLFHMGVLKFNFLYKEKKLDFIIKKANIFNSFVFGIMFSLGWTPCIGPMLGSVLIFAGSSNDLLYSVFLLFVYSIGLSIPFILTAIFMDFILLKIKIVKRYNKQINIISGVILIVMGIILYTGFIYRITF